MNLECLFAQFDLPARARQPAMKDTICFAVFILSGDDNLLSTWNGIKDNNAIIISFLLKVAAPALMMISEPG